MVLLNHPFSVFTRKRRTWSFQPWMVQRNLLQHVFLKPCTLRIFAHQQKTEVGNCKCKSKTRIGLFKLQPLTMKTRLRLAQPFWLLSTYLYAYSDLFEACITQLEAFAAIWISDPDWSWFLSHIYSKYSTSSLWRIENRVELKLMDLKDTIAGGPVYPASWSVCVPFQDRHVEVERISD